MSGLTLPQLCSLSALLFLLVHLGFCAVRYNVTELLERHLRRKRSLTSEDTGDTASLRFLREAGSVSMEELSEVLALDDDASVDVIQTAITVQGTQIFKLQERYKGEDVWDGQVALETDDDGHVLDASGTVYRVIDLDESQPVLDHGQALDLCLRHHGLEDLKDDVVNAQIKAEVMFDEHNQAYQGLIVTSFLSPPESPLVRPACLVDARAPGSVTASWDALNSCNDCQAKGVGGNRKIGNVHYGRLQHCLEVRREGDVCYLENRYVQVLDNNFTMATSSDIEKDAGKPDAVSNQTVLETLLRRQNYNRTVTYDCLNMEHDAINGAYSPLLDALFYGTVVSRMFEDWYGLPLPVGEKIVLRVHTGEDWVNAAWTGRECLFGDGNGTSWYPLVSLDILAHEIAHGVTEKNAILLYFQQSGGLNEAFSDMCGEAAEAYLEQQDWLVGADVTAKEPALRYFKDPPADNMSISQAQDFKDFMDPHLSSGVYNRVFYVLAHDMELPVREVFGVFLQANRLYWHHQSTFLSAACDVMKAAYDLGQDGHKFREAFRQVGLEPCEVDTHVVGLVDRKLYRNLTVRAEVSPTFTFALPQLVVKDVTVHAHSAHGDVILEVSNAKWGHSKNQTTVYAKGAGNLTVPAHDLVLNSTAVLTITLSTTSQRPLHDVTLRAAYTCVSKQRLGQNRTEVETSLLEAWEYVCSGRVAQDQPDQEQSRPDNTTECSTGHGDQEKKSPTTPGDSAGTEEQEKNVGATTPNDNAGRTQQGGRASETTPEDEAGRRYPGHVGLLKTRWQGYIRDM